LPGAKPSGSRPRTYVVDAPGDPRADRILPSASGRMIVGSAPVAAGGDADVVLAALAHAVEPLTVDELALASGWSLDRVAAALDYAVEHPRIAEPVALRRTEPGTYTVTARLDRLTTAQRHNLAQVHLYRNPLTPEQANALLAVLAVRSAPEDYLTHRQDHLNAERVSNAPASSTPSTNPTTPRLTPTCFYSRRYQNALADH